MGGLNFISSLMLLKIAYNGFALGAVADFGALNSQYTTKADAR
jgi:hypothetical protein